MLSAVLVFSFFVQDLMGQGADPRCPPSNEGWAVHIPHEYDCTKFYKCDWGVPKLFECEPGLHFSVTTERCEYPEDANCELGTATTRPTTTRSTTSLVTTTTPYPVGARCPIDDDPFNNPIFLPHEEDCSLFYMCFFGDLILYQCSVPGTHWSVELNRCDDPEIANCRLGQETSSLATTTTRRPWDPRCPLIEDPENPVHLPHEYNCNLFYRCDNGERLLEYCPGGIHWRFEWKFVEMLQDNQ
jgi:hypothetical protein